MQIELEVPCFTGFYQGIWDQGENEYREIEEMKYGEYDDFDTLCFGRDWAFNEDYRDNVGRVFAEWYADLINRHISPDLKLIGSEVVSPREYNFTTDRIFAKFELDDYDALVKRLTSLASQPEYRSKLAKIIRENHTSYDGFWSFMSNDIEDWYALLLDPENNEYVWCLIGYLLHLICPNELDYLNEAVYEYVRYETDWHCIEPITKEAKEEWEIYLKYRSVYTDWVKEHPYRFPNSRYPYLKESSVWEDYKEQFMEVAEAYDKAQREREIVHQQPVLPGILD